MCCRLHAQQAQPRTRTCPASAEGDNIPLKLQCLRQDIYKHLYEGTEEDGHTPRPKPPPGAPLNMTFDQFYDQVRRPAALAALWIDIVCCRARSGRHAALVIAAGTLPANLTSETVDAAPAFEQMWSQFTVWDGHEEGDGKMWTEEKEKQQARRKFVLLDSNSDAHLTAEVGGGGGGRDRL